MSKDGVLSLIHYQSERFEVNDLVAQGSTWGPLMTSASIDTIGKEAQETGKCTFIYKDTVKIPPSSFVDDVLAVSNCGTESIVTNAVINTQIRCKKLRFGKAKCHQMHKGDKVLTCPNLFVNQRKNNENMKKVSEDTY